MKKILTLVAFAALLMTACNKQPQNNNDLSEPVNKVNHASLTVPAATAGVAEGKVPFSIELTSGGEFVLGFKVPGESDSYVSGKYTYTPTKAAPGTYDFGKYGKLVITNTDGTSWPIEYKAPEGTTYPATATAAPDTFTGTMANDLCRIWVPKKIIVTATGEGLSADAAKGITLNSADIKEIAAKLNSFGIKIDATKYEQFSIQSISYTESGKLLFNFKDYAIAPLVGNFKITEGKEENLDYDFTVSYLDNPVFAAKGNGTVTVANNMMTLYTKSVVTYNSKNYNVTATVSCEEQK